MSTTTTNYNLIKPELSDAADITNMNPNWDTIDKEIARVNKPVVAESSDGVAYVATVDGITELYNGLTIRIIPNRVSASIIPTLNVNGLGASRITLLTDVNNSAAVQPTLPTWLSVNRPVEVTYHEVLNAQGAVSNTYWVVEYRRTSVSALYGSQLPNKMLANNNTEYADKQLRNIFLIAEGSDLPTGDNGDICIVYTP